MSQKELIYKHLSNSRSLLIVLDACRYDSFLENRHVLGGLRLKVIRTYSSGSCTRDWLLNTFTEPINAVYVTANPWVALLFKDSKVFKTIDDVTARFWDEKLGTVRAEHVNLAAIKHLIKGGEPNSPLLTTSSTFHH